MHDPKQKLERYEKAKAHRQNFVDLFEECYEYALPQRESFYYETAGQRRDDKIFDETAVVGVQEFASRLQSGLVPNFARWADLIAGSEIPKSERDFVDNDLDEITEYVFEVLQNSNFQNNDAYHDFKVQLDRTNETEPFFETIQYIKIFKSKLIKNGIQILKRAYCTVF